MTLMRSGKEVAEMQSYILDYSSPSESGEQSL